MNLKGRLTRADNNRERHEESFRNTLLHEESFQTRFLETTDFLRRVLLLGYDCVPRDRLYSIRTGKKAMRKEFRQASGTFGLLKKNFE